MAKSELNTYGPVGTSWSSLKALDADKTPMPNQGMKAIAAICGQAAAMGGNFQPSGLGNIIAGNNAVMMPPAHQISGMNGAALAGLALAGGALALSTSGKGQKAEVLESKKEGPPAPPTEVPAATTSSTSTTTASPTETPKTPDKTPDPTPTKTPGLAGPGTITLSDDAAKKLKGATWIGVGSKPGDTTTENGEKVPTSIKVIPVKDGETQKKGYEMIEYNGNKYWVAPKDQGTYASWNKAFGTNFGGLKDGDTSSKEDPTPPKPVAKVAAASPTPVKSKEDVTDSKPPVTGAKIETPSALGWVYTGPPSPDSKTPSDAGADTSKADTGVVDTKGADAGSTDTGATDTADGGPPDTSLGK